nr:MAG TPA: hypothetical protein [Caudoviricetes sp.]
MSRKGICFLQSNYQFFRRLCVTFCRRRQNVAGGTH